MNFYDFSKFRMGIGYEQLAFWLHVLKGQETHAGDIRGAFKELLDYGYSDAIAQLLSFPVVAHAVSECPHLRLRLFSYHNKDVEAAREVRLAAFLYLHSPPSPAEE